MLDQATTLRLITNPDRTGVDKPASSRQPVAIAVTSGKGGVGKTNVTANLAVALAKMDRRVTVLDADFGLANIDVLLGLVPRHNLRDVIFGQMEVEDIVLEGPDGVRIIPACCGVERMAALTVAQQTKLIRSMMRLGQDTDYLLIDTAAGISSNVIHLLMASGMVVVVTTPEPTAIVDAYLVVKILARRDPQKSVSILVNSVVSRDEATRVFQQIDAVSQKFLSRPLEFLGFIEKDKNVLEAVRRQESFVSAYPDTTASKRVKALARKLDRQCASRQSRENISLVWNEFVAAAEAL